VNLNIYRDRGQKPILKGFINNPVLGCILIEFDFFQRDNIFRSKFMFLRNFIVDGINIY
jgi:hypothetical protein